MEGETEKAAPKDRKLKTDEQKEKQQSKTNPGCLFTKLYKGVLHHYITFF